MVDQRLHSCYDYRSIREFRNLILNRDEKSDEAAFYLLQYKLHDKLANLYRSLPISTDFEDTLSDFFLMLRDGNGKGEVRTFAGLEGIRSWFSFESWILKVYKNFLLDLIENERRRRTAHSSSVKSEAYNGKFDLNIRYLGVLFSEIEAIFSPRDRFIFYRSMLTDLNKYEVIDNADMAGAMGISYDNYRQIERRSKLRVQDCLSNIQKKGPKVKAKSEEIAGRVENEFEHISDVIHDLYESTLLALDNKEKIERLRKGEDKKDENTSKIRLSLNDEVKYSRKSPVSDSEERYSLKTKYSRDVDDPFNKMLSELLTGMPAASLPQAKKRPEKKEVKVLDYSYMFSPKGRCWNHVISLLKG